MWCWFLRLLFFQTHSNLVLHVSSFLPLWTSSVTRKRTYFSISFDLPQRWNERMWRVGWLLFPFFWTSSLPKHYVLKEPPVSSVSNLKKQHPPPPTTTTHNWLWYKSGKSRANLKRWQPSWNLVETHCRWVSFPSAGLFFPFSVGFLLFLSCHSGMFTAFHCKFKAHSGNHWRRPGNRRSFVCRENKRGRKHAAFEFSKSLWQHKLSNNAVNHTWTGLELFHDWMAHVSLWERTQEEDGTGRKVTTRKRESGKKKEKLIHNKWEIGKQKEKHSCIIKTQASPGQTPPSACPKD